MCEPRPKVNIINLMNEDFEPSQRKEKGRQVKLIKNAFAKNSGGTGAVKPESSPG